MRALKLSQIHLKDFCFANEMPDPARELLVFCIWQGAEGLRYLWQIGGRRKEKYGYRNFESV